MWITYFIDDKLGGIASLNDNLISNNSNSLVKQRVVLISTEESTFTRNTIRFDADEVIHFNYSNEENFYDVIKRLRQLIASEPGAMVLNDIVEMQLLDHFQFQQTTYQIIHDQYNFELAMKYSNVVDVFIAHSKLFYNKLCESFPQKKHKILYLPHGVPVPENYRKSSAENNPIQLLFLGRMTASKGIFDLPVIADWLKKWNIKYRFTCIGNGPELAAIKDAWKNDDNVIFLTPSLKSEVMDICAKHDIFVLPTKFEGSPVALLETMSAGLVPVITDLPGGIREIVTEEIGFRIAEDDNQEFAEKIRLLNADRNKLNLQSTNARNKIVREFDTRITSRAYHQLFAEYKQFYSTKMLEKKKMGSRLDQRFIPSFLTRLIRKALKNRP